MRSTFLVLSLVFISDIASEQAAAQAARVLNVAPDGQEVSIPLTIADQNRDVVLLAESTSMSAETVSITLSGVVGASGKILTTSVPKNSVVAALDLNSGWSVVNLGDTSSTNILVGSVGPLPAPTAPPVNNGQCPPWMTANTIALLLLFNPGMTEAQLCAIYGGGGGSNPAVTVPTSSAAGSGVIYRDSCSAAYKNVVQYRISLAGQPDSVFAGGNTIRATLKVAKTSSINAARLKAAEGRDGHGAWIYLSPAIRYTWDQKYGAPGSDKLIVRKYRDGKVKSEKKFLTRPLFGSVIYDISPVQSVLKGGQLTFITQNGTDVYSRCVKPATKRAKCFGNYGRRHGIRCG